MPHKLVGDQVTYTRPVIIKPGFRRMNEDTNQPEEVAAEVRMVAIPATIVGVEPRYNEQGDCICPNLHLAFLHPDRLHSLSGSGWREAFDRALSVPPASHPDRIEMTDKAAFYVNDDVEEELYQIRSAKLAAAAQAEAEAEKAKAAAAAAADDTPPTVTQADATGAVGAAESGKPSADDLDRDAEEKDAKEATKGNGGNGRKPKPVAIGK